MNLIDHLNWRYATKMFHPALKIGATDLAYLKEAVRLAVSSYGLQLYKVLIVENQEIRQELRKASWDQPQITDASHLFIFCNYINNFEYHVDEYIQRVINAGADQLALEKYGQFIKSSIDAKSVDNRNVWAEKQTYLALSNLLLACAERKIDACPMEGFDNLAYDRILGLSEMGLHAAVIAPVGYRSAADDAQKRPKIRKSIRELFELV